MNEKIPSVTSVRAGMFNRLVKDGTILEILKNHNTDFPDLSLKEIIDNAMQNIQEEISNKGAYTFDDMSWSEVEQLEKFIEKRINDEYNKHWKNELNFQKTANSDENLIFEIVAKSFGKGQHGDISDALRASGAISDEQYKSLKKRDKQWTGNPLESVQKAVK